MMKNLLFLATLLVVSFSALSAQDEKLTAAGLPPTHADVAYDSHNACRLDFWQARGEGPRPLFVSIHGVGWIGGTRKVKPAEVQSFLDKGISYASIDYRLTGEAILPAPVHDADPHSSDPVERESTRVQGAMVRGGQTAIDPPLIEGWLGPKVNDHAMIFKAVGATSIAEAKGDYRKHKALFKEFSPHNHVSKDDPPLYMAYGSDLTLPLKSAGHGIHYGVFGVKMKGKVRRGRAGMPPRDQGHLQVRQVPQRHRLCARHSTR